MLVTFVITLLIMNICNSVFSDVSQVRILPYALYECKSFCLSSWA
jgi:hypothetical protein